jgi:predicted ATP-dependent endonuclease of OLD family
MLESITLTFTDSPDLQLPAAGITVFVGPNNSGKSLVLREIETALIVHPFPTEFTAGLRRAVADPQ